MANQDSPPELPPLEKTLRAEAHERLRAAEFKLHHVNPQHIPKCELWENKHGKIVDISYTDDFEHAYTDSLEVALQARDLKPRSPFASIWATLFGREPAPEVD